MPTITYARPAGIDAVQMRIEQEAKLAAGTNCTDLVPVGTKVEKPIEPHVRKLSELGFDHQVKWQQVGSVKEWGATTVYPELTGDEFETWRLFLPTTYDDLRRYRYDVIPVEAIDAMHQAMKFGCFDRIEIWTDQGNTARSVLTRGWIANLDTVRGRLRAMSNAIDPMAVGVLVGHNDVNRYFPIARWGKDKLVTVEQAKRHNNTLVLRGLGLMMVPLVFMVMAAVVALKLRHLYVFFPAIVVEATLLVAGVLNITGWTTGLRRYRAVLEPRSG